MQKFICLLFTLFTIQLNAQQTSPFIQAAEHLGLINPAGLSLEEMQVQGTIVNINIRNQWWNTQVEGKPTTQVLSWLQKENELNHFGVTFISDQIGETKDFSLNTKYAHALGKRLKIGVSIGGIFHRINISQLDQFDENDPLAAAGENRWKLNTNVGIFYHYFEDNRAWSWFAGTSFQRTFFISTLSQGGQSQLETNILTHGGMGWNKTIWLTGRFRYSINLPPAIDLYFRNYFTKGLFAGLVATSNINHHTIGAQVGYEWPLEIAAFTNTHWLVTSLGFSKPLSQYINGSNIIFDAKVSWIWDKQNKL